MVSIHTSPVSPPRVFAQTLSRIKENLSVQRDAKDLEIYEKVCEIGGWVDAENIYYSQDGINPI